MTRDVGWATPPSIPVAVPADPRAPQPVASHAMAYWLMKSEPDVFGYDDLVRVKREGWDGIRNYQARNFLRDMRKGDQVIFYHSNATPPGVAGVAKIVKEAEPDPTQFDPKSKYFDEARIPRPALGLGHRGAGEASAVHSARRVAHHARTHRVPAARPGQPAVGDAAHRRRVRAIVAHGGR